MADDFADNTTTKGKLVIGSSITGEFEEKYDRDWFKVHLDAGTTYRFWLSGAESGKGTLNGTSFLSIRDAQGVEQLGEPSTYSWATDSIATLPFTPTVSGDYFVDISAYTTGTYTLNAAIGPHDDFPDALKQATPLAAGVERNGEIGLLNDHDWFKISVVTGQLYNVRLTEFSLLDVRVYDTSQRLWSSISTTIDSGKVLDFNAEQTGDYYIDVSGWRFTGNYTVQWVQVADDYRWGPGTTATLAVGSKINGKIDTGNDQDWFRTELQGDTTYIITATALEPQPLMYFAVDIYGNDGKILKSLLSHGGVSVYTPPAPGSYFISISGPQTGRYVISATVPEDDYSSTIGKAGILAASVPQPARFNYAGDSDMFKMDVQAGHVYELSFTVPLENMGISGGISADLLYSNRVSGGVTVEEEQQSKGKVNVETIRFKALQTGFVAAAVSYSGNPTDYKALLKDWGVNGADRPASSDTTAPQLTSETPVLHHADGTLTLHFTEAVERNGQSAIVYAGNAVVTVISGLDKEHVQVAGSDMTLKLPTVLMPGETYKLRVLPGFAIDAAGNVFSTDSTITFQAAATVQAGPENGIYAGKCDGSTINGGAGIDTVVYKGWDSDYGRLVDENGIQVSMYYNPAAKVDTLVGIERVIYTQAHSFAYAFDTGADGIGGRAYRLYQAAFDRVPDLNGLGYWLSVMDKGTSLHDVAQSFIASAEFNTLYGANSSDTEFVAHLYQNVLHRAGDTAGVNYWLDVLKQGIQRADVLASFSESKENIDAIAKVIGNGFAYIPYG
jgi:hypothetical protein